MTTRPISPAKLFVAFLLASAAMLPMAANAAPGSHPASSSDVTVHLIGLEGKLAFCTSSGDYATTEFQDNGFRAVKIPAGQRVTLRHSMSFAGYNASQKCAPALSFMPVEGKQYAVNVGLVEGKCFIELVREDARVESGVVLDTNVRDPSC